MSKSLGNFIDLPTIEQYMDKYSRDGWRWYMVNHGPLDATDSDFQAEKFHEVYNSDLVNTVGNCASRTLAMIGKYFDGKIPEDDGRELEGWDLKATCSESFSTWKTAIDSFDLDGACDAAMHILRSVDGFINGTEPFKIAKDDSKREELAAILYRCAESVRIASLLLWPVLPEHMASLWDAMSIRYEPNSGGLTEAAAWGNLPSGTEVQKVALFPRIEFEATSK
jgi:methionyl-tRNA synthetase